jgi:hypothetical protein
MKCDKCLYKDLFHRLEEGYEIIARDKRTDGMEVHQYNKKGEIIGWCFISYPRKKKGKL